MPNALTIDALHRTQLVANVLTIEEAPGVLMTQVALPNPLEFLDTDRIEFGREDYVVEGAPYIPSEAEPIWVGDRTRSLETMTTPNQALKKTMQAGQIYNDRMMGESVHIEVGGVRRTTNRLQEKIDKDQRDMVSRIQTTKEWWVSQMILGQVSYSASGYDAFNFDFGRSASHNAVVGTAWFDPAADPEEDIIGIDKLVAYDGKRTVRIAMCSPEAARTIRQNEKLRTRLDTRHLNERIANSTSYLDNTIPYSQEGSLRPIGMLCGIEFWEYDRAINMNGVRVPMIRPNYIEFMPEGANNGVARYSAPFHNLKIGDGAPQNIERFSFSWENLMGTERHIMVAERQLMVPKRPDVFASLLIA